MILFLFFDGFFIRKKAFLLSLSYFTVGRPEVVCAEKGRKVGQGLFCKGSNFFCF